MLIALSIAKKATETYRASKAEVAEWQDKVCIVVSLPWDLTIDFVLFPSRRSRKRRKDSDDESSENDGEDSDDAIEDADDIPVRSSSVRTINDEDVDMNTSDDDAERPRRNASRAARVS